MMSGHKTKNAYMVTPHVRKSNEARPDYQLIQTEETHRILHDSGTAVEREKRLPGDGIVQTGVQIK